MMSFRGKPRSLCNVDMVLKLKGVKVLHTHRPVDLEKPTAHL